MQQVMPKIYAELSSVADKFIKSPSKVKFKRIHDNFNSYPYVGAGAHFEVGGTTDVVSKTAKSVQEAAQTQNVVKLNPVNEELGQDLHYFG